MIKKLDGHPSAQAFVVDNGNDVDLYSYTTRVVSIRQDADRNRTIECTGLYSRTTIKHIGWFLREYAPDLSYYDVKPLAGGPAVAM